MSRRRKRKSGAPGSVFSAILAGGVFLLFFFAFDFHILIALSASVGTFIAGVLIATPKKPKLDTGNVRGVTAEMLEEALDDGYAKLDELKSHSLKIRDMKVKRDAKAVCDIVERILEDIEKDPKDLKRARQFLNYYLEATIKIMKRYVDLSTRSVQTEDVKTTLAKVESSLHTLKKAYEKQLAILLEDDVMDLDIELDLLEKTIKMEGLGNDEV